MIRAFDYSSFESSACFFRLQARSIHVDFKQVEWISIRHFQPLDLQVLSSIRFASVTIRFDSIADSSQSSKFHTKRRLRAPIKSPPVQKEQQCFRECREFEKISGPSRNATYHGSLAKYRKELETYRRTHFHWLSLRRAIRKVTGRDFSSHLSEHCFIVVNPG